ncbi:LamG-like jellyroll fold domain-containing protein [Pseudoroseicyclus aestuarii]|uniref:PKD domain-containing protein n=1 Tax=Pseudoroseicyclus aestuarii TaxID=1795041 RepID=A0A318SZL9_9RHOB|nr:LamG-like jellyroll fold domain-containing protein [Pseudoroseicyclus aestuarii]PYE82237.1 PKD domain-containing protein [Pseudoroseicyclus aestuarii]
MTAAAGASITVHDSAELSEALKVLSAGTGGTIRVANAGEAYNLVSYRGGQAGDGIRIVAEDPGNPPVFEQVKLVQSQNISFENLLFDSSEVEVNGKVLEVLKSSGISFSGNRFVSGTDEFYTGRTNASSDFVGQGLGYVRDSSGIVFDDNEVSNFHQGLAVIDSTGLSISGNSFSKMSGDGLRLSGIQDTLIEANLFENFYGSTHSANHDDMIQVWSAPYNTLNTENLTIRGNLFNSSGGAATQTIFIKNEMMKDTGTAYKNITIEDNTIYNGHVHGVTVYDTDGVQVHDNTLLWDSDAGMRQSADSDAKSSAPRIQLYDVANASVSGNIADQILAEGVRLGDNAVISYSASSGDRYVGSNFVNALASGQLDLRDLTLLSDSGLIGYGSSVTQPGSKGELTAVMRATTSGSEVTYTSLSHDADGLLASGQARCEWIFEDGVVLRGSEVTRTFAKAGEYDVTLVVMTNEGSRSITRKTHVEPNILLDIDFDGGVVDDSIYASKLDTQGAHTAVDGVTGEGFHLDGDTKVKVDRFNDQLQSMETFTIDLSLKRDEGGEAGTFLHMYKSLGASITADGALKFTMTPEGKHYSVSTRDGLVSDSDWHRITVSYDGTEGGEGLKLYVDGRLEAELEASGVLDGNSKQHLVIGNSWNDSLQGTVDDLTIRREANGVPDDSANDTDIGLPPLEHGEGTHVDGPLPRPEPEPEAPDPDADAMLLALGFDDGILDASPYESKMKVQGEAALIEGLAGEGLHLDGETKVKADRFNDQLQSMETFIIDLSLKRDEGGEAGTFLHMHKSLRAQITEDGALKFTMTPEDRHYSVSTRDGLVSDSDWHRITVSYDGREGGEGLKLYVDGRLEAELEASGVLDGNNEQHLVIGNSWNDSLQGTVDELKISGTPPGAEADEEQADQPQSDDPSLLLDIDFDDGVADSSLYASALVPDMVGAGAEGRSGEGFHLDGGTKVKVDRFNDQLQSMETFTIDLSLKRDEGGEAGTFLHMHKSLRAQITEDGALKFTMTPEDKHYSVSTRDGLVSDSDWHRITVSYDGREGGEGLKLYVDGRLEAELEASGVLDGNNEQHLVIGNSWHESLQGTVDDLTVRETVQETPILEAWEARDGLAAQAAPLAEALLLPEEVIDSFSTGLLSEEGQLG